MDLLLPDYLYQFIWMNQQEEYVNFQCEIIDNCDLKKCILTWKAVPSVPHNNRFWSPNQHQWTNSTSTPKNKHKSPSRRKHNHNRANKWRQSVSAAEGYSQDQQHHNQKLGDNSGLINSSKVSQNCSVTFDSGCPSSCKLTFLTDENFHQLEDFIDQSDDISDIEHVQSFCAESTHLPGTLCSSTDTIEAEPTLSFHSPNLHEAINVCDFVPLKHSTVNSTDPVKCQWHIQESKDCAIDHETDFHLSYLFDESSLSFDRISLTWIGSACKKLRANFGKTIVFKDLFNENVVYACGPPKKYYDSSDYNYYWRHHCDQYAKTLSKQSAYNSRMFKYHVLEMERILKKYILDNT